MFPSPFNVDTWTKKLETKLEHTTIAKNDLYFCQKPKNSKTAIRDEYQN